MKQLNIQFQNDTKTDSTYEQQTPSNQGRFFKLMEPAN